MPSFRAVFLVLLPLVTIGCHAQQSSTTTGEQPADSKDSATFVDLVHNVPKESLEAALHGQLAPKYRDGIFEDIQVAIEAVHNDDPELASRLVDLARQDAMVKDYLRARAATNGTTTVVTTSSVITTTSPVSSPSSISSSSQDVTSATPTSGSDGGGTSVVTTSSSSFSSETGVLVPITSSSTNSVGSVIAETTSVLDSTAQTSVSAAVTTTNTQGQTITSSALVPATVISTTNSLGSTVVSTSLLSTVVVAAGGSIVTSAPALFTTTASGGGPVVLHSPTVNGVYTVTDNSGRTYTVTYTPTGQHVSQLSLRTTTLPNGALSTVTSVVVVGAATSPQASPTGSSAPHLQSGASSNRQTTSSLAVAVVFLLAGAFGLAGFLL